MVFDLTFVLHINSINEICWKNHTLEASAGIKLNNRSLVYDNVIGYSSDQCKIIIHTLQSCNSQLLLYKNLLECYEGDGSSYRGKKKTTIRGRLCQNWAIKEPHNPEKQVWLGLHVLLFWLLVYKVERFW